ncbi:hypothetical protein [Buttiauxella gaviniae]|uniref:hypothetical protein n=1 Tax=Buttiauxella gaviniae TaxID=82990 RepID=UPI003976B65D
MNIRTNIRSAFHLMCMFVYCTPAAANYLTIDTIAQDPISATFNWTTFTGHFAISDLNSLTWNVTENWPRIIGAPQIRVEISIEQGTFYSGNTSVERNIFTHTFPNPQIGVQLPPNRYADAAGIMGGHKIANKSLRSIIGNRTYPALEIRIIDPASDRYVRADFVPVGTGELADGPTTCSVGTDSIDFHHGDILVSDLQDTGGETITAPLTVTCVIPTDIRVGIIGGEIATRIAGVRHELSIDGQPGSADYRAVTHQTIMLQSALLRDNRDSEEGLPTTGMLNAIGVLKIDYI